MHLFRSFLRSPLYFTLNLLGFGLGLAAAFLALLYAWQEFNYDRHFKHSDRIYRISSDFMNMGGFANGPEQLIPQLLAESAVVEHGTRFKKRSVEKVIVNEVTYEENGVLYVDSAFFRVFDYPFLVGNPQKAMLGVDEAIVSEEFAHKYFGDQPAVGQRLRAGPDAREYQITGVIGKKPHRAHIDGSLWLPSYNLIKKREKTEWMEASTSNYVQLKEGATQADLQTDLDRMLRNHVYPMYGSGMTFEAWEKSENRFAWIVKPLNDIYLYSKLNFEMSEGGNADKVYGFLLTGLFILLIGIVNYINLVTARAAVRAKEVGIRKTLGIGRGALLRSFLAESAIFGLAAALVGLAMSEGLLRVFNDITGSNLLDLSRYRVEQVSGIFLFALPTSLLAGIYPALFLSRFKPTDVLKGEWSLSGNKTLRSALVVGQFSIAVSLMIGGLVVYQQLDYMAKRDWGFEKSGICVIENVKKMSGKLEAFRQEIARHNGVVSTSMPGSLPAGHTMFFSTYKTPVMKDPLPLKSFMVDADFVPTLNIKITAGRNFDKNMPTDTNAVLLNEAAVKALGLGDNPIGAEVNEGCRVIGVISDFNYESLRNTVNPLILEYDNRSYYLVAKINTRSSADFLQYAKQEWQKIAPETPFSYYFMDESLAALSEKETVLAKALLLFTAMAVFIACLGLFGLSAFTAAQRTKEIGIRKVLGASVAAITAMLAKDFLKLVLIAVLIASPIAWYLMQKWLTDFAYRVDIQAWVFVLAGLLAAGVAALTVGFQSIRAATADPVKSLRSE